MAEQMLSKTKKTQRDRLNTQRDRDGARNTRKGAAFLRAKTSHGRLKQ